MILFIIYMFLSSTLIASSKYWKVVYKNCGLRAIFQLFGAASIQVRLLFEGDLFAKFSVSNTHKSGLAHVK